MEGKRRGVKEGRKLSLKKRLLLGFGLLFILAGFGILLAELAVRLLFPLPLAETKDEEGRGMYGYQRGLRVLRPNYRGTCTAPEFRTRVESNAHGFRDGPFQEEKIPGTFRILALGDSFTFGLGVEGEEAYPELLEKTLSAAEKKEVEVFNLGIPGYGTREELEVLKRFSGYSPDLVMVGLLVQDRESHGNDLMDNLREWGGEEAGEKGIPVSRPFPARVRDFLRNNSHLYRHFELRFGLSLRRLTAGVPLGDEKTLERGWKATLKLLQEMQEETVRAGAELLVIYIPFYSDIQKGNQEVSKKLERFFRERGIRFCNLLPSFLRKRDSDFFFALDLHWNRKGHQFVAEELGSFLAREGILPWKESP